MRLRIVALPAATVALVVLGAGIATGVVHEDARAVPATPAPRVCWYSDYDNARLSNRCDYHADQERWYMEVDGRMVPADTQPLPEANLCHYFHGTSCPRRRAAG